MSGRTTRENGFGAPVERNGLINKAKEVILARENGPIELVDRKVFDYLLNRVHAELAASETVHRLPVQDILRFLKHSSTDRLMESLARLGEVDIVIRYYDDQGVKVDGRFHYLSFHMEQSANGYVQFSFDPLLMRMLYNPKVFGQLSLAHVRRFKSNYAERLYEVMTLYVNRQRPTWTTTVEDFRSLMKVSETYDRWDNLKNRVIEPAVAEVDEIAPFHVEVEYQRTGKGGKTTSLRFTARPKGPTTLLALQMVAESSPTPGGRRDPNTIDLLVGKTDAEREGEISPETLKLAIEMIGDNGHVEAYLENWRSEVSGRRIKNSDRAFLNWLDLNLAKKHQAGLALIEEDTLGGLLEAWDGNR